MKIFPSILTMLFVLTPLFLSAQTKGRPCASCTCILGKARAASKAKSYENAIKIYNSARNNCPPDSLAVIDASVVALFKEINGLLNRTEKALAAAKAARDTAENAKLAARDSESKAKAALSKAQKLIDAFYFYDDKYALAYGGKDSEKKFYFIDTLGNEVKHLGRWEIAEQFDLWGLSKIQESKFDTIRFLLNVDGNMYKIYPKSTGFASIEKNNKTISLSSRTFDAELREEVFQLLDLNSIDLSDNKLSYLSESIGNLIHLEEINLSRNSLMELPNELYNLINLKKIDLSSNDEILLIDEPIGRLKNLIELNLNGSRIESLPNSIGDLQNLEELDLSYIENLDTHFPNSFWKLNKLKKLYMNGLGIERLPKNIKNLASLTYIDLSDNPISISEQKKIRSLLPQSCEVIFTEPEEIDEN